MASPGLAGWLHAASPPALSDSVGPSQIPEPSGLALGWRQFSSYFRPSGPLDLSVGNGLKFLDPLLNNHL
ncbi:hypothetical protein ACFX19_006095 [Malus domestica]